MIKTELIDHMGDDLRVVNSARVSMGKESHYENEPAYSWGDEGILSEKDKKLINYLSKNAHFTPFTHCMITLRETVPVFVARQRFKHTVGFTYNEESRRYIDDEPEFYVPDAWRKRAENVKQGSSDEVVELAYEEGAYGNLKSDVEVCYEMALETYNRLLEAQVAPEQARMILPQSMMTSYYVTGSLAAFARAYKLRIDHHAQKEIRDLAEQWDKIIRPLFPVSWAALVGEEV